MFKRIFLFYYDGFKSMTVGKTLWTIIIIKLVIMFLIFRLFLFPNFMKSNFESDKERSNYMLNSLTE